MFKKQTLLGYLAIFILVSLAPNTAMAKRGGNTPMDDKTLMVVYYDGVVQFVDLQQSKDVVKALKNFKNEKQILRIVYCDGVNQKVKLIQPKPQVKSYRFFCPEQETSDFGGIKPIQNKEHFKGNLYYLDNGTSKLPDLSKMTPVGAVYTQHIDIPSQAFDKGFPGVTDRFEWFAVQYKGKFHFKKKGEYKFRLHSDDGSKLYIDGKLVIDNDGLHAPASKTGTITLNPGKHKFRVDYYQGPRHQIALQLFVTPPGKPERIF